MYYKHVEPAELIATHARGLKDHELAALFRVSLSTIKRRREALGLGSNCPRNNVGRLGEQLVARHLTDLGLSVTPTEGHNAPSDLLVNGWRVDVKVGHHRANPGTGRDAVEFHVPARRSSDMDKYSYPKNYQRDTDFFALAVLSGQEMVHLYVLPASRWKPTITIHPDCPFCEFLVYRDNVASLRSTDAVAA
ncbi:hypothetical protein DAERI_150050 [Deinococcus aerius]|uniref:PD(D/E)XK endonuclease domain-containing protein n=1 Tax=Deinococcus aerius TaxID=200253 RepID=A0A2I9CZ94_9DEIO|nr:hypothetical protein [Deinococcus aerius]GBF07532.1 hypothetical protein DAERI_150050 [Deinococcus aerius]